MNSATNPPPKDGGKPEPEDDPIFFHKGQIKPGTMLRCHGRSAAGTLWRVVAIETYVRQPTGKFSLQRIDEVRHLRDIVHLRRDGAGEVRAAMFGGLSYSAIWRLADGSTKGTH
jgi:hypothetical protein